jgi:hypothetical protein
MQVITGEEFASPSSPGLSIAKLYILIKFVEHSAPLLVLSPAKRDARDYLDLNLIYRVTSIYRTTQGVLLNAWHTGLVGDNT